MMWWHKRRKPLPPTLEEQRKMKEAREALEAAERANVQVKQLGTEVHKVATVLRNLREDDFGALLHRSMMRR